MENLLVIVGIICCLQTGVWSQEKEKEERATVTLGRSVIEAKRGENVSLECYGSDPDLGYYIGNRLLWNVTNHQKHTQTVSSSFYATQGAKALFDAQHYRLDYGNVVDKGFLFNFTIFSVTDEDDGFYTCTLIGKVKNKTTNMDVPVLFDRKVLRLIVLRPVEQIVVRIVELDKHSTTPLVAGDMPVKVKPGKYQVHCEARGSNPAPILVLMYNEYVPYIVVEHYNMTFGKGIAHKASTDVHIDFDASLGVEQTLVCSAKMPNGQYPKKEAGMLLHVSIDEPDIVCANISASTLNRQVVLLCNISTPSGIAALSCDKVSWVVKVPKGMQPDRVRKLIPAFGDTTERRLSTETMDIMEADCMKKGDVMVATLMIYRVKEDHFIEPYYVKYDKFEIPVTLYQIVSSAHVVFPSLLSCVAVAVISKLAARTL